MGVTKNMGMHMVRTKMVCVPPLSLTCSDLGGTRFKIHGLYGPSFILYLYSFILLFVIAVASTDPKTPTACYVSTMKDI